LKDYWTRLDLLPPGQDFEIMVDLLKKKLIGASFRIIKG
jgi:hypothetical protein